VCRSSTGLFSSGFSAEAFLAWRWPIPFFNAVLVLIGLWIRAGVEEPEEYVEHVTAKLPILEAFKRHLAQITQIVGKRFIELLTMDRCGRSAGSSRSRRRPSGPARVR